LQVDGGSFKECCGLEDGSLVSDVVYLRERNARCFEDTSRSFEEILITFFLLFTLGLRAGLPHLLLVFMISFLISPLPLRFSLVYSLCA
jgi:hypothetical protein